MKLLVLRERVGEMLGSRLSAEPVRYQVEAWLEEGELVVLDFEGVEIATPSFVDELIGKLFLSRSLEELQGRVRFIHASPETKALIRRMIFERLMEQKRQARQVQTLKSSVSLLHSSVG